MSTDPLDRVITPYTEKGSLLISAGAPVPHVSTTQTIPAQQQPSQAQTLAPQRSAAELVAMATAPPKPQAQPPTQPKVTILADAKVPLGGQGIVLLRAGKVLTSEMVGLHLKTLVECGVKMRIEHTKC